MSIWYRIKSQKQLDTLIKKLEKCGYNNSNYGCPKEDCVAIALYDGEFDKSYTFLNGFMCIDDPYYSWTNNREEVFTEAQFIKYIMKTSDFYADQLGEISKDIKQTIIDFIKEHIIDSLNITPYCTESYVSNFTFYDMDKNGNGIAYNLDSIEVTDKNIIFNMEDNDGYYSDTYNIDNFSISEKVYVLCMLEQIFDVIETFNLPILKLNETFDDYAEED